MRLPWDESQSESRMRETRPSGSMSGVRKRSDSRHRAAPRLHCASRKGAEDQRMRDPPEELSVRLGSNSDGSTGQPVGSKLRANPGTGRGSNRMGRNTGEGKPSPCERRAGLESEDAAPSLQQTGEGRRGSGLETEWPLPAAGVMTTARAEGSLRNVRGPAGRPRGRRRHQGRRTGRESDRPIVPKGRRSLPVKPLTTAEGRGLTSGVLVERTKVTGDWR